MVKRYPQTPRVHCARHIGLTGGIGAGKSSVAKILERLGFVIIDADTLTAEVYEDVVVRRALTECFGATLCPALGVADVDRKGLGAHVFEKREALQQLNTIMQPAMRTAAAQALANVPCERRAVLDAALLYEAGWDSLVEASVVVLAPQSIRLTRAAKRLELSEEKLAQRLAAQLSDQERATKGDAIIYNVAQIDALERQVRRVFIP